MRAGEGAAGGAVTIAARGELACIIILDIDRRQIAQSRFQRPLQGEDSVGKRAACRIGRRRGHAAEPIHRLDARGGDRGAGFRHLAFDRGEKALGALADFQQPVALAHGAVECVETRAMRAVERRDHPVEKAAAFGCRAGKHAVHGRNEPQNLQILAKGAGPAGLFAVDLDDSPRRCAARADLLAGAQRNLRAVAPEPRRDGPAAIAF